MMMVSRVQIVANFLCNVLKANDIDDDGAGDDDDDQFDEEEGDDDEGGCPDCAEFPVQCAQS